MSATLTYTQVATTTQPISAIRQAGSSPLSYQQLDILHSLRGFCAFYVVIFHAKFILWAGGRQYLQAHPRSSWGATDYVAFGLDLLSSAGYEMVIFFFVLSGFFIRYAQHKKHRPALSFYRNRVARIYPPFLVSLALAAGALLLLVTQVPQVLDATAGRELNATLVTAWDELRNFSFLSALRSLLFLPLGEHYLGDNAVYWSLLPEGLFYLLAPLAFRWVRWYYAASALLALAGLYCDWRGIMLSSFGHFFFTYNAYFAIGMALYDAVVVTNWLAWIKRLPKWLALSSLAMLLLALITVTLLKLKAIPLLTSGTLAVLAITMLLAGHVSSRNPLMRVLHKIGEFSFSLYLYHYPLLLLLYGALVTYTNALVIYPRVYWLAVPLVTAACYGLYLGTERLSVRYLRG